MSHNEDISRFCLVRFFRIQRQFFAIGGLSEWGSIRIDISEYDREIYEDYYV